MATNFRKLLETLAREEVKYVIIGGVALVARGARAKTAAGRVKDIGDLAFIQELKRRQ